MHLYELSVHGRSPMNDDFIHIFNYKMQTLNNMTLLSCDAFQLALYVCALGIAIVAAACIQMSTAGMLFQQWPVCR